jgi:DNA-binding NarL/FixJ family response regulator
MASVRIAVVEDREIVRIGLQTALEKIKECQLVGVFANIRELSRCLQEEYPQIVILDDTLPGIDIERFVRRLKQEYPGLRIIVCGSILAASSIYGILDAEADGFIYKGDELISQLPQAIAAVSKGEPFILPQYAKAVLNYTKSHKPVELTERLKEVLSLIALGFDVKQIAQTLGVTDKAVYNARDRLKELLNAKNAADILHRAVALKLIEAKDDTAE